MIEFIGDPVATASQHEQELAALELTRHPTVQAAYRDVAEKWLSRARASQAMRERFDDAFTEVMFSAAVWSSNQDKLRPKVSCITRLSHPVASHQIPGSRWGIDNPDSVYRVIPISGDERYEIHGRDISAYLEGVNQGVVFCDGTRHELTDTGNGAEEEERYFLDCLKHNRPIELPACNVQEAIKTMELAEAILAGLRED